MRCPHCLAMVVDRRLASCTTCRHELPAGWVMSREQIAKTNLLDAKARAQYAESLRILSPLTNPDAPALVRFLNQSSISGNP
jgi:hypothetical protein